MSLKTALFGTLLRGFGPANSYDYLVVIPGLFEDGFLVESTSLPSAQRAEVSVDYQGERVALPATNFESSGKWACTIVETKSFAIRYKLLKLLYVSTPWSHYYFDVYVFPIQGGVPSSPTILKHCWLQGRNPATVSYRNVTEPLKWDVIFVYNGIVEPVEVWDLPLAKDAEMLAGFGLHRGVNALKKNL